MNRLLQRDVASIALAQQSVDRSQNREVTSAFVNETKHISNVFPCRLIAVVCGKGKSKMNPYADDEARNKLCPCFRRGRSQSAGNDPLV
jgi:hypothetical protein